jgi:hypothetical protein
VRSQPSSAAKRSTDAACAWPGIAGYDSGQPILRYARTMSHTDPKPTVAFSISTFFTKLPYGLNTLITVLAAIPDVHQARGSSCCASARPRVVWDRVISRGLGKPLSWLGLMR